jgi:hypothetical protein
MNKIVATLGLAATLAFPAMAFAPPAEARSVTLTTQLRPYGGNGAYLAIYLVDAQGRFHSTLRVAGGKAKYYTHLSACGRCCASLRSWSAPGGRRAGRHRT